ncbi:MAG: thiamine pyrophosphate-binding protein [bacterium]
MKLADYVINYLADLGVRHVFLITGGAVMNLVDSFRKNDRIDYVCVQHEQAGAMAAEAYSRVSRNIGVAMTTSGPGATNLITGICCAYFDSIPNLYITGQVNTSESKGDCQARQIGFQETDIVDIVRPITKFAIKITEPKKIKYYLDKAVYVSKSGRPGPVLLDIPMDIQRAEIDPDKLESFVLEEETINTEEIVNDLEQIFELIEKSKRPLVLFGAGVKLAKAEAEAEEFIEKSGLPFTMSWAAVDLFGHDHPLFSGTFGVSATRYGNFTVQNADFLLVIGSRLDTRQTGGRPENFAPHAKKVFVDIEPAEMHKKRGLEPDLAVISDAKNFLTKINKKIEKIKKPEIAAWLLQIKVWKEKYPICLPEYKEQKEKVNIYYFMKVLSEESNPTDVVITDAGGNLTWTMQGFAVKKGQQLFSAFGHSPMGYSLPAAIGASFALDKKPTICIIGDGGIQINIQELQTIFYYRLPIKIFVINNNSYGIIKQFQDVWLESRYEASCPEKGCSFPNFIKVAEAYGIATKVIENNVELKDKIKEVLAADKPVLCDVRIPSDQKIIPKLEFGRPIEDSAPLLDRDEFLANMIVKPKE